MSIQLVYATGVRELQDPHRLLVIYQDMISRGILSQETIERATVKPARPDRPFYVWAIYHKGVPYGGVSLFDVDFYSGVAEIGIILSSDCPKLVGARAYLRVSLFSFETLRMRKLEAWVRSSNGYVVNMMKRYGYRKEGVSRKSLRTSSGSFEDAVLFGIMKEEFMERWGRSGI